MTALGYAIAPEGCSDYLTAGRAYPVKREDDEEMFVIADDEGDEIHCLWRCCAHAHGNWERSSEATPTYPPELIKAARTFLTLRDQMDAPGGVDSDEYDAAVEELRKAVGEAENRP